jgi:glycerophosphoryl diester phosphodiesterase
MKLLCLIPCLLLFPLFIFAQHTFVAHRGASFLAPENTQASINLAWKLGASAAECDVLLTKDGQIVVFHDKNTSRLLGESHKISETDFDKIKDLHIALNNHNLPEYKGETVPLLKDLLIDLPDSVTLVVEIKCGQEILSPMKKVLDKYWKSGKLAFIAFGFETIMKTKETFPEIPCYFLAHMRGDVNKRIDSLLNGPLDGVDLNHAIISKKLVDRFNKKNKNIWCYTVDSPKEALKMISYGVLGITTNRPEWLKKQVSMVIED